MSVISISDVLKQGHQPIRDFEILNRAWNEGIDLGCRKFHIRTLVEKLNSNLFVIRSDLAKIREINGGDDPRTAAFIANVEALADQIEKAIELAIKISS